jgi:ATP-dependent DNA ligase
MFPDITKKDIKKVKYPCSAEIKYDGECVAWRGERIVNSYDRDMTDSVMPEYLSLPSNCLLWGEMYHGEGKSFTLHQLNRLRKHKSKVIWFDIIYSEGKRLYGEKDYEFRRMALQEITSNVVVRQNGLQNEGEVLKAYRWFVEKGYEGTVVKAEHGYLYNNWVKLKRNKKAKLYVRGIRKGKNAVSIGTLDHIYCSVSTYGWNNLTTILEASSIVGEDKENYLIEPKVKVEVEYQQLLRERDKLRHPFIRRICTKDENLVIPS